MAILGTFETQVIVNGAPAAEYDDDEESLSHDPTSITKYVEAVSGAFFEFHIKIRPTYKFTDEDALVAYAYVDGQCAGGKFAKRRQSKYDVGRVVISGQTHTENGISKIHKLKFADLKTRDMENGDDPAKFKEHYSELGILSVKLSRVRITGDTSQCQYKAKRNESVPEKALKGRPLDVVVSYESAPAPMESYLDIDLLDPKPLAEFIFKYRTRRALQTLMIIERSPTPLPLEERPVEELTREEMTELLRRQREQLEIKQEHATLKRERAGNIQDSRPLKSSKGENGEVIYHLDSDDEAEDEVKPKAEVLDDEEDDQMTDPEIEVVDL